MSYNLNQLHKAVNAIVPIVGVDADFAQPTTTWACWLADGTRALIKDVAPAALQGFNPAAPAPAVAIIMDANYVDLVSKLTNATPTQIQNYVQNNVTDLASAKVLLTKILLLLAVSFNS